VLRWCGRIGHAREMAPQSAAECVLKSRCIPGQACSEKFSLRTAVKLPYGSSVPAANLERTALNSPLQGTAADLIKLAMIAIAKRLKKEKLRAQMILQVHDELLFEAPPNEKAPLERLVREEMEGVYQLAVPLAVEICTGPNWRDME
jgi:DNA polymerase I-like protein with 3'-5' exonuclease and polymerase domains